MIDNEDEENEGNVDDEWKEDDIKNDPEIKKVLKCWDCGDCGIEIKRISNRDCTK